MTKRKAPATNAAPGGTPRKSPATRAGPKAKQQALGSASTSTAEPKPPKGKSQGSAEIPKEKRPPLPSWTDVPFPQLRVLTAPKYNKSSRTGKPFQQQIRKAQRFVENADVFMAPVRLTELRARRHTEEHLQTARDATARLADRDPQALSCIIVDEVGEVLVAYCSYRLRNDGDLNDEEEEEWSPQYDSDDSTSSFSSYAGSGSDGESSSDSGEDDDNDDDTARKETLLAEAQSLDKKEKGVQPCMTRVGLLARAKPLKDQYHRRTLKDLSVPITSLHRDGIPDCIVERALQATQALVAAHRQPLTEKDARHCIPTDASDPRTVTFPTPQNLAPIDNEGMGKRCQNVTKPRAQKEEERKAKAAKSSKQSKPSADPNKREGVQAAQLIKPLEGMTLEAATVMHMCHNWQQQGSEPGDLTGPSAEMLADGLKARANKKYYLSDAAAIIVAARFKVIYPTYYKKYKKYFDAGVWVREDPGPFLGRAIVYKLQVYAHRDRKDAGPSVTYPVGYYKGGSMCFPDIDAKFLYAPGDMILSMSADLYHSVEPWEPVECPKHIADQRITPGRISTVFFCPKNTAATLEGKRPLWSASTDGGSQADCHHVAPQVRARRKVGKAVRKERRKKGALRLQKKQAQQEQTAAGAGDVDCPLYYPS